MIKVTYIERMMIDRFTCIDKELTFNAVDYQQPAGTNLIYFKVDRFNLKVIEKDFVKAIETI